jgi:hypothetical protein
MIGAPSRIFSASSAADSIACLAGLSGLRLLFNAGR